MSQIIERHKASSIEQLNDIAQNGILGNPRFLGTSKHFRGQSDIAYKLQTRIAAKYEDSALVQQKSREIYDNFIGNYESSGLTELYSPTDMNLGANDKLYYNLFQAQHLGVPTPLMDWTFNWRNALYFAIEDTSKLDKSGEIFVLLQPYSKQPDFYAMDPFHFTSPIMINAPYDADANLDSFLGEKRRHNQAGQFLILPHNNCTIPLEDNEGLDWPMISIEILPELKKQVHALRDQEVNDELMNTMRDLRLNFKKYDSEAIYGNMNNDLKEIINKTRIGFGFSSL